MYIHLFMTSLSSSTCPMLPPLPCVCATLRRSSRLVTGVYDEALRPSGLRVGQFTILQILHGVGPQQHCRLGHRIGMDSTTLSRTLKIMEGQSWVRSESGEDRRERYWHITSKGDQVLQHAKSLWDQLQGQLLNDLGQDVWSRLSADLERLNAIIVHG